MFMTYISIINWILNSTTFKGWEMPFIYRMIENSLPYLSQTRHWVDLKHQLSVMILKILRWIAYIHEFEAQLGIHSNLISVSFFNNWLYSWKNSTETAEMEKIQSYFFCKQASILAAVFLFFNMLQNIFRNQL